MDPARNPYSPGAGTPPPELAGRGQVLEDARVTLTRIKAGRPSKSQMLLGLRGVGKTVLLNRIEVMEGFFRVRLDRLTPREKNYMRAMAGLGPGPHRSGEIAQALNTRVQSVGPIRQSLIKKGMIYSPAHGDTAFTVPMFDEFLLRSMPPADDSTLEFGD